MTALPKSEPAALPDADDEFLQAALEEAELPSLLCALAHVTGDLTLLDGAVRPTGGPIGALVPVQGGMSAEMQKEARGRALDALRRLRDDGSAPLQLADSSTLRELMTFVTGRVADSYVPLMAHELGLPRDAGEPDWRVEDLRPGTKLRVVVIGAGMSGLVMAHRLRQIGADVMVLEKNGEVGGTWLENVYPGCRLDTTNFGYSYSFAQVADWPQQYSPGPAILTYFQRVADDLELRRLVKFNTEVTRLELSEDERTWAVTTVAYGHLETFETDVVVSAVGQLNQPNIPSIEGLEDFAGPMMHTARWDDSVDLNGKRVVVIGTGASAFQAIPHIAERAARTTVLQRTPPWMLPAPDYQTAIAPGLAWLLENVPHYHRWYRFQQFWMTVEGRRHYVTVDPTWESSASVSAANEDLRLALEGYLREQFADRPDLLPHVIPDYPPGAKRMLRDDGTWARTLKRDDVDLVVERIERIEPGGVRTTDGVLHRADVIVLGTGFRASEFLSPMEVVGRAGLDLREPYGGDVRAYLGITIADFPNLFCLYGPNTNLVVNGSTVLFSEMGSEYILGCLRMMLERGAATMEIDRSVFDTYNRRIDEANTLMAWGASGVNSWYKSASGRVSQNWPLTIVDYWEMTRDVRPDHYRFQGGADDGGKDR
jgi:4-hydroxyacetophenone monooxygenase